VNADCRGLRTSVGRVRILAAGLTLLAIGGTALGLGFHWQRQSAKRVAGTLSTTVGQGHIAGTPVTNVAATNEAKRQARSLFAGLPLMFEPNLGQGNLDPSDTRAKFVAQGSGYSLFLGSEGAILNLRNASASHSAGNGAKDQSAKDRASQSTSQIESVQMKLAGANPNASVTAENLLPGKSNYLIGNDPAKWKRGVPQFARVRYENVYPGINLVFYGNQGRLEYDFQVAPGSNPQQAELEFDASKHLELKDGALVIKNSATKSEKKSQNEIVRLEAPQVYQEIAGRRQPVEGRLVLRGAHRVGFAIGNYDHSRELVIDPVFSFATYFGGSGNELNNYVAVDQELNIYLAGSTTSSNLPLVPNVTVFQDALGAAGATNVYIAKITPGSGSASSSILDYVTYLGGNGIDYPVGIAVDGNGDPYLAGTTTSTNFPTSSLNAYQTGIESGSSGTSHVFVTEMNSTASALTYSSYLSGSGTDIASGMTIDVSGYIYVTGSTTSTNASDFAIGNGLQWPVTELPNILAYQAEPKASFGVAQFFVTKVNPASSHNLSIIYSTYFGGGTYLSTGATAALPIVNGGGIAVDTSGNIYFSGTTNFEYQGQTGTSATDFPILNAYQPCLNQPAPTTIVNPPSCTYVNPPICTYASGAAVCSDAFLAKLNPNAGSGSVQLGWSTYVGGSETDSSTGIAVDTGAANVYIVGTTNSPDIAENQNTATTSSAFQRCLDTPMNPTVGTACTAPTAPAPSDAFVAKFPNLTATTTTNSNLQLSYFSYLGGSANEEGLAITVDNASGAAITGWTQSNMSSTAPFYVSGGQNIGGSFFTGFQDVFVARLNTAATTENPTGSWTAIYGGSTPDTGTNAINEGTGIALDVNQNYYVSGDTNTTDLRLQNPVQFSNAGGSDAFVAELGTASSVSVSGVLTLTNGQTFVAAGNEATFTYTITNGGPDPASNIIFTDDLSISNTLVPVSFDNANAFGGECGGGTASAIVSCSIPSLQAGSTATVTVVITPTSSGTTITSPPQFTGGAVTVTSENSITTAPLLVPGHMTDFTLSVSPASNSVVAGNTASYQITLTPEGGIYSAGISLACSDVPAASSCNFSASPVTLPGTGSGSSILSITTTIRPINTTSNSIPRHFYALWLFIPGLAVFAFGSADRRRRHIAGMLLLCAVCSLIVLLPACNHTTVNPPVSGTPAGTYYPTVTATSGTDAKSYTIQLTVE
jgi:uncharacterized repeat protein (TIGR01451 family)